MKLKYISCLPAVIIMMVIFLFSAKPAVSSNESSMTIADSILKAYENITDHHYVGDKRIKVEETINHYVRKGAHFCEYAILAVAFALHFTIWKINRKRIFLLSILLSALYAATDEFHQRFVPGRSGMVRDVLLDTSGAVTGTLIFMLLSIIILRKIQNQNRKLTS